MEKLDQFQLYLLREGKTRGTIEKDIDILKRLMQLEVLAGDKIDGYLLSLLQQGRSSGYLNNIVKACHTWGKFINDTSLQNLKFFKVKETNKATMSDKEIEAFLSLPKPKQSNQEIYDMFTLFFKIMAYSGMRAGEVTSLTIPQVDFGRNVFILDITKTNPRLVPIAPILVRSLTDYIKTLDRQELFIIQGHAVTKSYWNDRFHVRVRLLGIKRPHLSTHSLRHSFITRLLSEDVNIFKVQRIVGHNNIETTNHYTHLVTKDLTIALTKDPLGRHALPYEERFKQFREQVRKLLEGLSLSLEEEKKMLADLTQS